MFAAYFKATQLNKAATGKHHLTLQPISTHSRNTSIPTTKVLSVSCTEFAIPSSPHPHPRPYDHVPTKKYGRAHTIAMSNEITGISMKNSNTPGYPKHIIGISYKTRRKTYDGPEGDHPDSKEDEDGSSGEFTIPTLPRESREDTNSHYHGHEHIIIPRSPSFLHSSSMHHIVNVSNMSINKSPLQIGGNNKSGSISSGPTQSEWNHTTTHDGDTGTFPCRTNTPGLNSNGTIIVKDEILSTTNDDKLQFISVAKAIVAVLRMNTNKTKK